MNPFWSNWFKKEEPVVPPIDPITLRTEITTEIATELRQQMSAEIERVTQETAIAARAQALDEVARALTPSPASAIPSPNQRPPYGAYAFDRPITFSTPQAPTRKPLSLVSTDTLRQLADSYDILRACINELKREVLAVPLEIVPRDAKDQRRKTKKRLEQARDLFTKPGAIGGFGTPRRHFEGRLIEDLCVVGAGAVYHEKARGGWVRQSVDIDAATIRPWVDAYGWAPADNGPGSDHVYEQWVYGVQVAAFSRADLTYDGIYPLSYSPYFKSPIEYLIDTVDTALRSNLWNKGWLTDGNSPDDAYAMPENWTADQIINWTEYWDSLTANGVNSRHKTRFLPSGSQRVGARSRKDQDFTGLDLWLLRRTCAIMGVQPASIGFVGEQYKTSQENSMDQTSAFGAGVILAWRKDLYDDLLERHGFGEFEVQNVTERSETAKERAETNEILIRSGQRTPNECRIKDGEDPHESGDTLLVQKTLVPLDFLTEDPEAAGSSGGDGSSGGSDNSDDSGQNDKQPDPADQTDQSDQQDTETDDATRAHRSRYFTKETLLAAASAIKKRKQRRNSIRNASTKPDSPESTDESADDNSPRTLRVRVAL